MGLVETLPWCELFMLACQALRDVRALILRLDIAGPVFNSFFRFVARTYPAAPRQRRFYVLCARMRGARSTGTLQSERRRRRMKMNKLMVMLMMLKVEQTLVWMLPIPSFLRL